MEEIVGLGGLISGNESQPFPDLQKTMTKVNQRKFKHMFVFELFDVQGFIVIGFYVSTWIDQFMTKKCYITS